MPTYQYVNKTGTTSTVEATSSDLAIKNAPDIASTSGVSF